MNRPALMSIQDLSDFLGVPVNTIYDWRTRRYGPQSKKIGRFVKYEPDAVLKWIDELEDGAA